jgi:adenylate cyclase
VEPTCPSCGSPLSPADERCPRCGEPVAAAERKLVTVLFADLTGFTALAKTLDPEDVHAFLRPAMTALRLVVEDFGGAVPQMMGESHPCTRG